MAELSERIKILVEDHLYEKHHHKSPAEFLKNFFDGKIKKTKKEKELDRLRKQFGNDPAYAMF